MAARGLIGIDPADKLAPPILTWLTKNAYEATRPHPGQSNSDWRDSAEAAQKALEELLQKTPDVASLYPLLEKTVRRNPESGRYVLHALGTVKKLPPATVDFALTQTSSGDEDTREAAIELAGKMKSESDVKRWVPEAIRLLRDKDESVRLEAIWALKGVKGQAADAAPELARLLAKDEPSVRKSAASAFEEIGNIANPMPKAAKISVAAAAKGPLASAMKDKDHELATAAVGAYNVLYIENAELIAALADVAVSGADVGARQRALGALRNRQGQGKSALAAIKPLTQASDKLISDDAKTAVEWIERGGGGSPSAIKGGSEAASTEAAPAAGGTRSGKVAQVAPVVPAVAGKGVESSSGNEERGLAALREKQPRVRREQLLPRACPRPTPRPCARTWTRACRRTTSSRTRTSGHRS